MIWFVYLVAFWSLVSLFDTKTWSIYQSLYLEMETFMYWWLLMYKVNSAIRVPILKEAIYISDCVNTLGKGMNPTMGK